MRGLFILLLLILSTLSVTAQVTESPITIEKKSSKRLFISETELDLLKIKFVKNPETIEVSEVSIFKNKSNRLVISETEEEILKNRFFLSAERVTRSDNRKQIVTDPEGIGYFQNNIKIE